MKSDSSDVRFFLSDGTILSSQYISNLSDTYFVYNFTHPADTSVYCAWGNASTPALEYTESGDLDYHENGESTTNWTVETSTIESSTTKVHSGTHSLKYTDLTANSFDDECTYMLPSETSEITLEYWASPSQTNTYSRMCPFDGAASDRKGPWVAFANDGAIEYYTGSGWNSDGTPYNTTNWYKIKLVCSGSTYDFYINDTLVHSNIATYNPVTAYDRIVIFGYTASGTSCYFDDINISYPSISLPSLQSTFRMPATSIQNSYSWDLDNDGDVDSTSLTPSFTYSSYGLYTVNLTVANDAFDISNVKTNYISLVNENRITPTITWSNPSSIPYGTALSSTQLNAQASVPGSFVYNPSSGTVLNAGTHALNCTFTPTDITNYTTATKSVSITVNTVTPVANFSSNTTGGDNPLSVQFTDLSRNSPTGWSWTFGDSQTSTSQNPVHTYSSAGAYNVTLTASNTAGNDSETKVNYITVTQRAPQSAAEWFWYLMSFVRW
jgi:PKD repeat protein